MMPAASQSAFDFLEDRCACCGAPATLLCDFIIGREWMMSAFKKGTLDSPGQYWYRCVDHGQGRIFTCDRPLCEACAVHAGNIFFDGKKRWVESIDHCPEHAGKDDTGAPVISEDEAAVLRDGMTAGLRVAGSSCTVRSATIR